MKARLYLFATMLMSLIACGTNHGTPDTQREKLGNLAFDVPSGWARQDWQTRQSASSQWTPSPNERKESLTITRTSVNPGLIKAGTPMIESLLREAHTALPHAKLTSPKQITSSFGFVGVQVETDYVPPGLTRSYHRVHAVLIDDDGHLIHVLYTAVDPDLDAFSILINNLHHEEA